MAATHHRTSPRLTPDQTAQPTAADWRDEYETHISEKYVMAIPPSATIEYPCPVLHLRIMRRDGAPIAAGWDLLQRIKNDAVGEECLMVEFYPPQSEVVDEINARHFWTVPNAVIVKGFFTR